MLSTEPLRSMCIKYNFVPSPQSSPTDLLKHIENEVGGVLYGGKEEVYNFGEMCRDYRKILTHLS